MLVGNMHVSIQANIDQCTMRCFSTYSLWQLIYLWLLILAQDGDTSGSDSPYEREEENSRSRKAKGKEATSSRTISRPTGRPPQLRIKEEPTNDQDVD